MLRIWRPVAICALLFSAVPSSVALAEAPIYAVGGRSFPTYHVIKPGTSGNRNGVRGYNIPNRRGLGPMWPIYQASPWRSRR